MTSAPNRIRALQRLTVGWMAVELVGATWAAIGAHSVALMAFGADSGIEMLSAVVVLWRFGRRSHFTEKTASRINAWLLILLAIYIVGDVLYVLFAATSKPTSTYFGMAVLVASAVAMPWLARQKRQLAEETQSNSLRADSVQSSLCGYLAWIALAGLVVNTVFGLTWADPLAALALVPFIVKEAREAYAGKYCC